MACFCTEFVVLEMQFRTWSIAFEFQKVFQKKFMLEALLRNIKNCRVQFDFVAWKGRNIVFAYPILCRAQCKTGLTAVTDKETKCKFTI